MSVSKRDHSRWKLHIRDVKINQLQKYNSLGNIIIENGKSYKNKLLIDENISLERKRRLLNWNVMSQHVYVNFHTWRGYFRQKICESTERCLECYGWITWATRKFVFFKLNSNIFIYNKDESIYNFT